MIPIEKPALFQRGTFTLSSGQQSDFKIECDALTDADLEAIAYLLAQRLPPFGAVQGIPRGGLKLAEKLKLYSTANGSPLIVDDVLTTGKSMDQMRPLWTEAIGAVIFARGKCPDWITPLFTMTEPDVGRS